MSVDEARLGKWMQAVLEPRMGHLPQPWPASLRRALVQIARERNMGEDALLVALAARPDPEAVDRLVAAASVPHTLFFRHTAHFARLTERLASLGRPARIWCAGCASGEEPYSVALTAIRAGCPVAVLATDVNDDALAIARRGWYPKHVAVRAGLARNDSWEAPPEVRSCIRFVRASITDPDPCPGEDSFDFVFCRNVLLYFEPPVAHRAIARLAGRVRPGGALILSPVEALRALPEGLHRVEPLGFVEHKPTAATAAPRPTLPPPTPAAPIVDGKLEHAARALGLGMLDEAELTLRGLLDFDPRWAEVWFLLAEVLLEREERGQARIAFDQAARHAAPTPEGRTLANAAVRRAAQL